MVNSWGPFPRDAGGGTLDATGRKGINCPTFRRSTSAWAKRRVRLCGDEMGSSGNEQCAAMELGHAGIRSIPSSGGVSTPMNDPTGDFDIDAMLNHFRFRAWLKQRRSQTSFYFLATMRVPIARGVNLWRTEGGLQAFERMPYRTRLVMQWISHFREAEGAAHKKNSEERPIWKTRGR